MIFFSWVFDTLHFVLQVLGSMSTYNSTIIPNCLLVSHWPTDFIPQEIKKGDGTHSLSVPQISK